MSCLQRQDAVITQTVDTAPDHHITMLQGDAQAFIGAFQAAEEEGCGQAQRDRDNRRFEITLVSGRDPIRQAGPDV